MAQRTSEEAVKEILEPGKDYRPGAPLGPAIRAANKIVDWIQNHAADYGMVQNDVETARELEGWIAAWAYKASHQQYASAGGRGAASFRGQSGKGFEMNNYGQVAMQIDGSGLLAAFVNGSIVGTAWLGKALSEMLTYDERNV